jgi:hypothetical protein
VGLGQETPRGRHGTNTGEIPGQDPLFYYT